MLLEGGNADLLCDLVKSHSPHPALDTAGLDNECAVCNASYADDKLHDRQKNWHSEDMVWDMVHDECGAGAYVLDKHPEAEGMVVVARNPTTLNHGDRMGNVEVDEEVEDATLVEADVSLVHA